MELKLIKIREASGEPVTSSTIIADLFKEEARADRECYWVVHLNTAGKIIEKELVAMGVLDSTTAHPREVFKKAIINSAKSIITVHNHPSGNVLPSDDDEAAWERLISAGDLLKIPVLDNIIVSPVDHYSDRENRDYLYGK